MKTEEVLCRAEVVLCRAEEVLCRQRRCCVGQRRCCVGQRCCVASCGKLFGTAWRPPQTVVVSCTRQLL